MKNTTSQTLPPEVENAIDTIASGINCGHTVIFCGAGISRDSGFPVVNEFVPYVLLTLCADRKEISAIEASLNTIANAQQRQGRLKQIIAKKMGVSPEVVDKTINGLPFEAFIETLRDNSKIDEIFEIYDAEAYRPHVGPNTNHIMLARLVAAGKVRTIVTTNFDQLIEKALGQQGKVAGRDYDVLFREDDFSRIDWAQDRSRLIKLHGSIDDKQAMAITLSQVAKRELSSARAGIIRHVFGDGDHEGVLILGYSCSDEFDLSPQIEALTDNLKKVCLVQHSGSPKVEDICEQKQKNPFKAFNNSTRLFLNTNDLVEVLWKSILKEPYLYHKPLKITKDWHTKVRSWYVSSVRTRSEIIKDGIPAQIFDAICEWRAAIGQYERVLVYARAHDHAEHEGFALGNMGSAHRNLGDYRKALELYEQALEIARHIGDVKGEGVVLGNKGIAYLELGDYRKALELYEQALEIARHIGDVQGESNALGNIGIAYRNLGEYRKALELYEQALELARRLGDVQGESRAMGCMGIAYRNLGDYSKALDLYEQSLETVRRLGDVKGEGIALGNKGIAYADRGKYREAIVLYEQAMEIARRIGDVEGECTNLSNMGNCYLELGEYRKAIGFFEQALEIARRIGDARGEGNTLNNAGSTYLELGEYRKAIEFFEQALTIARRLGDVQGEGSVLGNMGSAYSKLGNYGKAIGFFEQALEINRRIEDVQSEGSILGKMGSAYASMGDKEKAAQAFAQSKAVFAKLGRPIW